MKITDRIHLLQIDFEIALTPEKKLPRFVNVVLVFGDGITLIDTGVKGSEEKIFDYITRQNRDIKEIETVILSHSHPDHIGSAARIKQLTGCSILAHEGERTWIEDVQLQSQQRPVPGFFNLADTPVIIDRFLKNGQTIQAAPDITMEIIHSPGHSKGSLNILFREDRVLFTADSVPLKNDIPNYDNYIDLMKSLSAIKNNTDYEVFLSSWTPPLTDKTEIKRTIEEGESYMKKIETAVKECYIKETGNSMDACACVTGKLGLPPFMVNKIVDSAFRSHLT